MYSGFVPGFLNQVEKINFHVLSNVMSSWSIQIVLRHTFHLSSEIFLLYHLGETISKLSSIGKTGAKIFHKKNGEKNSISTDICIWFLGNIRFIVYSLCYSAC